jgi:hypothetical protein
MLTQRERKDAAAAALTTRHGYRCPAARKGPKVTSNCGVSPCAARSITADTLEASVNGCLISSKI